MWRYVIKTISLDNNRWISRNPIEHGSGVREKKINANPKEIKKNPKDRWNKSKIDSHTKSNVRPIKRTLNRKYYNLQLFFIAQEKKNKTYRQ